MSLLDEARTMLRTAFRNQPLLSVFWTAEPWRLKLVPVLVENGYLEADGTYDVPVHPAWRITSKAMKELRDEVPDHVDSVGPGIGSG